MVIFKKASTGMWPEITDSAVLGNFFNNEPSEDMALGYY